MTANLATYPAPYRLLFTASRYLGRQPGELDWTVRLFRWLRDQHPDAVVVHGGCPEGGDHLADLIWWECFGLPTETWPAAWDDCGPGCPADPHRKPRKRNDRLHPGTLDTWCPVAGPRRNRAMVESRLDRCFAVYSAFSRGSRGCATLARRAGIPTTPWLMRQGDVPRRAPERVGAA